MVSNYLFCLVSANAPTVNDSVLSPLLILFLGDDASYPSLAAVIYMLAYLCVRVCMCVCMYVSSLNFSSELSFLIFKVLLDILT